MYLIVEENPNCTTEERVFSTSGSSKSITQVRVKNPQNEFIWADVISVDENGQFSPAQMVLVEDSGAGLAWLIYGGIWGLRLRRAQQADSWNLENPKQWGVPFLVLDHNDTEVR